MELPYNESPIATVIQTLITHAVVDLFKPHVSGTISTDLHKSEYTDLYLNLTTTEFKVLLTDFDSKFVNKEFLVEKVMATFERSGFLKPDVYESLRPLFTYVFMTAMDKHGCDVNSEIIPLMYANVYNEITMGTSDVKNTDHHEIIKVAVVLGSAMHDIRCEKL
ncbi:hypothetical protein L596_021769 [Steinernema carpocapsae]|uniref:Uncharacterized protein n=1 Tax=Steinernema carpocapsae TaxID=34508 RepID=A0A4U5MJT8_STECR|nr:hypothetical protein L596_021769 [Steinernema carpocapsae]